MFWVSPLPLATFPYSFITNRNRLSRLATLPTSPATMHIPHISPHPIFHHLLPTPSHKPPPPTLSNNAPPLPPSHLHITMRTFSLFALSLRRFRSIATEIFRRMHPAEDGDGGDHGQGLEDVENPFVREGVAVDAEGEFDEAV